MKTLPCGAAARGSGELRASRARLAALLPARYAGAQDFAPARSPHETPGLFRRRGSALAVRDAFNPVC